MLAVTECEKTIAELKRALASNTLDSRQYQQAHQQLTNAEARMVQLNEAARQEAELRAKTLNQTRQQNARQAVTTLTKQGWTREDILQTGSIAQQVIGDKLADVMSPELMQVLGVGRWDCWANNKANGGAGGFAWLGRFRASKVAFVGQR